MKTKIIDEFINVSNVLLSDEFSKDEAVIIMHGDGPVIQYAVRGGKKEVSIIIIAAMAKDRELYEVIKQAVSYYEEHKEEVEANVK
jgi:hypothetical protein